MGLSQEFIDKVSAENPIFKKFFEAARYDKLTSEEKEMYEKEVDFTNNNSSSSSSIQENQDQHE